MTPELGMQIVGVVVALVSFGLLAYETSKLEPNPFWIIVLASSGILALVIGVSA